ncbi:MAG TPA: IS110 family transposase [Thermomicrobiales bacterium]|nr:IS110 family transposase [Thermomicrobiales bacterium]
MDAIHERCCGLDVHQRSVVACVPLTRPDGAVERRLRTFGTMTADLLALSDWLAALEGRQIALESTGGYWRPVSTVLEDEARTVTLVNPRHLKAVPGRKTDVKDAERLADLLRHGLVKASFIPPAPVRDLRELTRYRTALVQQRTQEVNRRHKVLEGANITLACVASDIVGVSGRAMLAALLAGQDDPEALAELARGRLRAKLPALRQALAGRVEAVHLVLVGQILAPVDYLEGAIAERHDAIADALAPVDEAVELLRTIPGVGAVAAAAIVAEIGAAMGRFPSAKPLASWAGLCPGNRQSGGKRLSGKPTEGDVWLKAVLSEVAWANARGKAATYFGAQFRRLARRRGQDKALVAVAHSLLVTIYHMRRDRRPYADLGPDYFDKLDADRLQRHHVHRLEHLGYTVTLSPAAA